MSAPQHLDRLLSGNIGNLVARPWFDTVALPLVTDWYLPLSRAWATGLSVGKDTDAFRAALGTPAVPDLLLRPALATLARRDRAYRRADAAWNAAFFGDDDPPQGLEVAETRRRGAAHDLMMSRNRFLPAHLIARFPAVRFDIAAPDAALAGMADILDEPQAAFALPGNMPEVAASRQVKGPAWRQYWLRFPSPGKAAGDTAWARVREPVGVDAPPTLIFAHGIFMEGEFWRDVSDAVLGLVAQGIRVIQPEAPWHGRRRPDGEYGGERIIARTPLGMHDLQESLAKEIAVLTGWARDRGSLRVGVGGVSLGALTAQLVACVARGWPGEARPDAMLLVTTSASIREVAMRGELGRRLGLPRALVRSGWTADRLDRLAPLMEPGDEPAIDPNRILFVLGSEDRVTPFADGIALADRWAIPAANRYVRRQGHFSASLGLGHDPAPLHAMRDLLLR